MKTKLSIRCVFAGSVLLATVLQTIAYLTSYTATSNYFQIGSILPIIAIALTALASVAGIAEAILSSKEDRIKNKNAIRFASAFSAVGFLLTGIYLLISASGTLGKVGATLLLLAAIYCILDVLNFATSSSVTFYLGFTASLGCILLTGYHYFDMTMEMNAQIKVSIQVALLFAMLFFTGELRYRLGKPQPLLYSAITAITVAVGAVTSIPVIVAYLAENITRFDYFCSAILVLSITMTASTRLISLYFAKSIKTESNSNPETD